MYVCVHACTYVYMYVIMSNLMHFTNKGMEIKIELYSRSLTMSNVIHWITSFYFGNSLLL